MATLVLWDIDFTLLDCGGLGREAHQAAFHQVMRTPLEWNLKLAGRTDLGVLVDALHGQGHEVSDELLTRLCAALAEEFTARAHLLPTRGGPLAGAARALSRLAAAEGVVQSVLTGNIQPIARTKLAAYGLTEHLDLTIGAYGDDHADRARLVDMARDRAGASRGGTFDAASTVLIGDTPNDVRAGRVGGARTIAVATGRTGADELRAAGADVVLDDLRDTEALTRALVAPNGEADVAVGG